MFDVPSFLDAVQHVFIPANLGMIVFGTLFGILCGAMPGLSSVMAMTILIPFTFTMDGYAGILCLLGVFCGSIYGGSITAILINTPGTSNSAATCLDGYPLTLKGQAGRALGISTLASTVGGIFSALALFITAPLLAKVALNFGAPEYFALAFFGLSIVTSIASENLLKGIISLAIGLALSTVGMDALTAENRFTGGSTYLLGGVAYIVTLIALYAFSQGMINILNYKKGGSVAAESAKFKRVLPTFADIKKTAPVMLFSSIVGTVIGAIPGTGGDIACWTAYSQAKRLCKNKDEFGKGAIQGVAAPEAANNAVSGGALIPLLTLGIPGDAGSAIMLGSLMMLGITPGPLLFSNETPKVYLIILGLLVANICMCVLGYAGMRGFAKISALPLQILTPMVFMFCAVGCFAYNHNVTDIIFMVFVGIIGFFLVRAEFPLPPIILGIILGNMVEKNLQRSLVLSKGSFAIFFTHPISCVLILIGLFSLLSPVILSIMKMVKARKAAQEGGEG
jgi:putative tricarboxylic transport membrane protein